jgi:hypothetical protein
MNRLDDRASTPTRRVASFSCKPAAAVGRAPPSQTRGACGGRGLRRVIRRSADASQRNEEAHRE